ncbi:MAG: M48 family metalloprotease [Kofleriaceae bacterium]|nr:M48 family metalloprotease [Kofleriaceae bacterium]
MGRALVVALALSVTACANKPPMFLEERMPHACRGKQAKAECAGWVFDRMMRLFLTPYRDARIAAYIDEVGQRLVRASGDRRTWTFEVLDDPEVQAFTGLDTSVFIHRGALTMLRDESELAAVLAHEIGHVLGNHARENLEESSRSVYRSQSAAFEDVRYARDDEIQADELAVLLVARAGYDASGVSRMLRAYAVVAPDSGGSPDDNHPAWRERIARVQALAATLPGGRQNAAHFRARLATLVVGRDPLAVSRVGEAIVFAHAGFAVDLPPHLAVDVDTNDVSVQTSEHGGFNLRILDARVAKMYPKQPNATSAAEVVLADRVALVIIATGPDASRLAQQVRARVRSPRSPELAALRPTRADMGAPRMLWVP